MKQSKINYESRRPSSLGIERIEHEEASEDIEEENAALEEESLLDLVNNQSIHSLFQKFEICFLYTIANGNDYCDCGYKKI